MSCLYHSAFVGWRIDETVMTKHMARRRLHGTSSCGSWTKASTTSCIQLGASNACRTAWSPSRCVKKFAQARKSISCGTSVAVTRLASCRCWMLLLRLRLQQWLCRCLIAVCRSFSSRSLLVPIQLITASRVVSRKGLLTCMAKASCISTCMRAVSC